MSDKKVVDIEEKRLSEALNHTLSGQKIIYVEPFGNVKIVFPSVQDSNRAEYEYSLAYNNALFKDGFPSMEEMDRQIRARGLWTDEDDKRLEELDNEIIRKMDALSKIKGGEKAKQPIQQEINKLQKERAELRAKRDSFYTHTAEYKADNARINYLVWACTYNADTDKRLWPTYEQFKEERNQKAVGEIATNFLSMLYGIDESLLSEPPQTTEEEKSEGEEKEKENQEN